MRSSATTVDQYASEVPAERKAAFDTVLKLVRDNIPEGYEEVMNWGMACWQIPLTTRPDTYNGQPLMMAALANQKNYLSFYLISFNSVPEFKKLVDDSGKKLKMGKSCINFLSADDLPLPELAQIVRKSTVDRMLKLYDDAAAMRKKKG